MPKASAGVLLHRRREGRLEVLLVHPGGPPWARRDLGAWSIPKGEVGPGEEPLQVARREFAEETGQPAPGPLAPLATVRQPGGKTVSPSRRNGLHDRAIEEAVRDYRMIADATIVGPPPRNRWGWVRMGLK